MKEARTVELTEMSPVAGMRKTTARMGAEAGSRDAPNYRLSGITRPHSVLFWQSPPRIGANVSETVPEGKSGGLKPFQNLPANCTSREAHSSQLENELRPAIEEMGRYYQSHRSAEPAYQNCKAELDEIRKLALPRTASERLLQGKPPVYLVTRHDGKIQGLAIVTEQGDGVTIDHASLAPWNIVPPPASEAGTPNPFRGGGWQMIYFALIRYGEVRLTPASAQAAQSFNKMGFRTSDGQLLTTTAGSLRGAEAEAFKKKMEALGST
jgi:hypothetical protein